jgi:cysteinyl-tRNA synthetase
MANYWMHNGFLQVEGEKMSKSLGNFVTIREILRGWQGQPWSGAATRWAMLQTHYRQPIDWTVAALMAARNDLFRLFLFLRDPLYQLNGDGRALIARAVTSFQPSESVVEALADDLNTPLALARIRERYVPEKNHDVHMQNLRDLVFLGVVNEATAYIFSMDSSGWGSAAPGVARRAGTLASDFRVALANGDRDFAEAISRELQAIDYSIASPGPHHVSLDYEARDPNVTSVSDLVEARAAARAAKDFARADEIRKQLDAMGIALKDAKDPKTGELVTTWEVKR